MRIVISALQSPGQYKLFDIDTEKFQDISEQELYRELCSDSDIQNAYLTMNGDIRLARDGREFAELYKYQNISSDDKYVSVTRLPQIQFENLQRQEILDRYYSKYKLLGKEPVAKLEIIDNKIAMTKVNDKVSDGIFEIPEYVEQIGKYSNPYQIDHKLSDEYNHPFSGCQFNKITVHNKSGRLTKLSYAFVEMISDCLVLEVDNPDCIVDIDGMFYRSDISAIDMSCITYKNIEHASAIFEYCHYLQYVKLRDFKDSNIQSINSIFRGCSGVINMNNLIKSVLTDKIEDANQAFQVCVFRDKLDFNELNLKSLRQQILMFDQATFRNQIEIKGAEFSNLKLQRAMFRQTKIYNNIDFSNCKFPELEDVEAMLDGQTAYNLCFDNCYMPKLRKFKAVCRDMKELASVSFRGAKMPLLEDMNSSFSGCNRLTEVVFDDAKLLNLMSLQQTFQKCEQLKKLDFGNVDLSYLQCINFMCVSCVSLRYVNLGNAGDKVKQFWEDDGAFRFTKDLSIVRRSKFKSR